MLAHLKSQIFWVIGHFYIGPKSQLLVWMLHKYSNTVIHYKYNNMNTVQRYRKSWLVKSLTLSTISWEFRQRNIFWKYGILEFEMVLFEKTFPNILWWNGCCSTSVIFPSLAVESASWCNAVFCRGFVAECAVGGRWHRWEAGGTPKSPEGSGRSPAHTRWPAAGAGDVRTSRDLSSGAWCQCRTSLPCSSALHSLSAFLLPPPSPTMFITSSY